MRVRANSGGGSKVYTHRGTLTATVNCGFKPKYILLTDQKYNNNGAYNTVYYNADDSLDTYVQDFNRSIATVNQIRSGAQITEITDTGFSLGYPTYYSANTFLLVCG